MWSRAPAEESERAVIDGDAACTRGSPTSARAYVGSWSHCPPFHEPPLSGIHFSWPRNGALLRGIPHDIDGKMWLQVNEIQQAGTEGFEDVRGQEKWMPADGGSWNGGRWLHEPKE